MKARQIALILIPLNLILAYFVYNSINSEVEFQELAKVRISENVQKLKDIRVELYSTVPSISRQHAWQQQVCL